MKVTMTGRLSSCFLLAYEDDADALARLLPPGLEPFTRAGRAYWNVVVSRVDKMRPRGLPRALGNSYAHVAHRVYARARTAAGVVEGLFFVRSDVDDALVTLGGNVATDFRFHRSDIVWREDDISLDVAIRSEDGSGDARVRLVDDPSAPMPPPFLKYNPLGLSVRRGRVRLAEVRRDEAGWRESPVRVEAHEWGLFRSLGRSPRLVAATRVAPLDYEWRLGRTAPLATRR